MPGPTLLAFPHRLWRATGVPGGAPENPVPRLPQCGISR